MDFQVGDTVQLKSGGPIMTIELMPEDNHEREGRIRCIWFDKDKRNFGDFVPQTLKKYDDKIEFSVM